MLQAAGPSQDRVGGEELGQSQEVRAGAAGPGVTGGSGVGLGELQVQWTWISNHKGPGAQEASSKAGSKVHEDCRGPDNWTDNADRKKNRVGNRCREPHLTTGRFLLFINFA